MRLGGECRSPAAAQHGRDRAANAEHDDPGQGLRPAAAAARRRGLDPARGGTRMSETLGATRSATACPERSTRGAAQTLASCTLWRAVSRALLASGVACVAARRACRRALFAPASACRRALLAPARAAALASCCLLLRDTMNLPSMLPPVSLPRAAALNHLFAASSHTSGRAKMVSWPELRGRGSPLPRRFMRGCQP